MPIGYQDESIPERGEFHEQDLREEAARHQLLDEARREAGSRPQSGLARLIARFRKPRSSDAQQ